MVEDLTSYVTFSTTLLQWLHESGKTGMSGTCWLWWMNVFNSVLIYHSLITKYNTGFSQVRTDNAFVCVFRFRSVVGYHSLTPLRKCATADLTSWMVSEDECLGCSNVDRNSCSLQIWFSTLNPIIMFVYDRLTKLTSCTDLLIETKVSPRSVVMWPVSCDRWWWVPAASGHSWWLFICHVLATSGACIVFLHFWTHFPLWWHFTDAVWNQKQTKVILHYWSWQVEG